MNCPFLDLRLVMEKVYLDIPPTYQPPIEVYGFFLFPAGEVSEAVDHVGQKDPEHNGGYSNSWYSYAWMTARKLNAQIHDIAQGGIALMNGTGCFSGKSTDRNGNRLG